MGYGWRHNASITIERYDLEGICNVLRRRLAEESAFDASTAGIHAGALAALEVLLNHEGRTQEDFFFIFDAMTDKEAE